MTNASILDQRPVPCTVNGSVFKTNRTFAVLNNEQESIDGKDRDVIYNVSCIDTSNVDEIVDAAYKAFHTWKATKVEDRKTIILRAAAILSERAAEISTIIATETVVPRGFAHFQVEHGARSHLEECAANMVQALQTELITDTGTVQKYIHRKPFGVVLGIAPWNAPFVLGLRAVLWAIAAGNTAILKTSEHAPLTHLAVAQLLFEAGLPQGVLSVVHVDPASAPQVTEALIAHPYVRKINFTGSTHVGRILAVTAASHLKPIILELGGKAPVIVLRDADIELAANNIVFGGFLNSNQICMAVNNILVDRTMKDALMNAIKAIFLQNPTTFIAGQSSKHQIRALYTPASAKRLQGLFADAIVKGASVGAGVASFNGAVVQPLVLQDVSTNMEIFTQETFGPILSMISFETEEEAVQLANQNYAGLAAAVFSRNIDHAFTIAQQIEAGQVHVNMHSVHDHGKMPHGGWKQSGYGRLGGGIDGIREFTQSQGFTVQQGSLIPLELL